MNSASYVANPESRPRPPGSNGDWCPALSAGVCRINFIFYYYIVINFPRPPLRPRARR